MMEGGPAKTPLDQVQYIVSRPASVDRLISLSAGAPTLDDDRPINEYNQLRTLFPKQATCFGKSVRSWLYSLMGRSSSRVGAPADREMSLSTEAGRDTIYCNWSSGVFSGPHSIMSATALAGIRSSNCCALRSGMGRMLAR